MDKDIVGIIQIATNRFLFSRYMISLTMQKAVVGQSVGLLFLRYIGNKLVNLFQVSHIAKLSFSFNFNFNLHYTVAHMLHISQHMLRNHQHMLCTHQHMLRNQQHMLRTHQHILRNY